MVHTQLRGPNSCKGLLGGECRLLTMASTSFGSQVMLGYVFPYLSVLFCQLLIGFQEFELVGLCPSVNLSNAE